MRRFLFVSLFFLTVAAAYARDIYVSNTAGNDAFFGITERPSNENGPVRTIQHALRIAGAGDRIVLLPTGEPYRESAIFFGTRNSCTPGTPFTLEGNGVILDGSVPVPKEHWEAYERGIFRFQPEYMAYANLFLEGKPLKRVDPNAIREGDLPVAVRLEVKEWCLYDGYIYFKPEPGKVPYDYDLRMAGMRHGLAFLDVRGVTVKNLTVEGFQNDGMVASNAAMDVMLENVVLRGNARSGLAVGGASRVFLKNCILGDNGVAQLWTDKLASVTMETTELISNTAPGWVENDKDCTVYRDGTQISGGLNEPLPPEEKSKEEKSDENAKENPEENPEVPVEEATEATEAMETNEEISEDTTDSEDGGFNFSTDSGEEESEEEESEEESADEDPSGEDDSFNFSL